MDIIGITVASHKACSIACFARKVKLFKGYRISFSIIDFRTSSHIYKVAVGIVELGFFQEVRNEVRFPFFRRPSLHTAAKVDFF